MFPLVTNLQSPAYVAGATHQIQTDRLLSTIDGMPNHIVALDLKLLANVTPGESDVASWHLFDIIDTITIRDVLANVILRLRGRYLRELLWASKGWLDHEGVLQGSGQAANLIARACIPFHGGRGGVAGFTRYRDCWLPVDRIRGIDIEVTWKAAPEINDATLNSAALYISARCLPYPKVVVGADVRYSFTDEADGQSFDVPLTGVSFHTVAICNIDRDHSDYTNIHIPDYSYLSNVAPWQLVDGWNHSTCIDPEQHASLDTADVMSCGGHGLTFTAPEFLPLIYQDARYSIQGAISFPRGRMRVEATNTNATTQELGMVQIHDTRDLVRKLMGRKSTVFELATKAKAMYEKKNTGSVQSGNAAKAAQLNVLLGYELSR
jgi:hypothetical protein